MNGRPCCMPVLQVTTLLDLCVCHPLKTAPHSPNVAGATFSVAVAKCQTKASLAGLIKGKEPCYMSSSSFSGVSAASSFSSSDTKE